MSCIFCRIVSGEIPAQVVARDADAVAFLDVQPLADGHVLVVPVRHIARVEDLTESQARAVFDLVRRVTRAARAAVAADGTTIGINDGPATGQTVPHVHVHVVPRRPHDGAGSVHTLFPPGPRRPVAEIATLVREALAG
jgi:histidine triad (HIT) family protein